MQIAPTSRCNYVATLISMLKSTTQRLQIVETVASKSCIDEELLGVVAETVTRLMDYREGEICGRIIAAGGNASVMVATIFKSWFVGVLPLLDVAVISGVSLLTGTLEFFILTAAAICVKRVSFLGAAPYTASATTTPSDSEQLCLLELLPIMNDLLH